MKGKPAQKTTLPTTPPDPFETALQGVQQESSFDPNAPSLDDVVTPVETQAAPSQDEPQVPAAPLPEESRQALDELADEITDEVILESIGLGFTVGLPIAQEQREQFAEAYAKSKLVKIGMKLTGLKGTTGASITAALEKSALLRIGAGALLLIGAGAQMRGQYVAEIANAQAQLQNGGASGSRGADAGFIADDLPDATEQGQG
jgi:hypothetical protein